ncbi:hypothetical protein BC831DRAFT_502732 [Entophlyctis helioformis]|nr:hypothetical protein BC831DRAFT_502732 [Entophlyctis helioformis]
MSSNGTTDPATDAGASDGGMPGFTYLDIFIQVCVFATLTTGMSALCIALSSRHLYAKARISKLPLIASIVWFLSAFFLTLSIIYSGTFAGTFVYGWLSMVCDIIARSVLLWFTYYRTCSVWANVRFLKYLTGFVQAVQLGGWAFMFREQLPDSMYMTQGDLTRFNYAVGTYASTDLLAAVIDLILVGRLWVLNKQMVKSGLGRQSELVKPLFFYFSIACMLIVVILSIIMAILFATGNDPFFGYNTILFSFRILLTDIFSNLMRDSLIEARADSAGRRASLASGSESRPMNDAASGSKSMSAAPAKRQVIKASHAESS